MFAARHSDRVLVDDRHGALHSVLVLAARKAIGRFVDVAVEGDPVRFRDGGLYGLGVMLDAPSGDEESLLEAEALVLLHDVPDAYPRPIFQHGHRRDEGDRVITMLDTNKAVGPQVEGDRNRDLGPIRPRDRLLQHKRFPHGVGL